MLVTELLQRIREAIARELEIPLESLLDDVSLRQGYGLDSVAAVNIVFRLENDLAFDIDIRKLAGIDTINQLKELVARELSVKEDLCSKEHG